MGTLLKYFANVEFWHKFIVCYCYYYYYYYYMMTRYEPIAIIYPSQRRQKPT